MYFHSFWFLKRMKLIVFASMFVRREKSCSASWFISQAASPWYGFEFLNSIWFVKSPSCSQAFCIVCSPETQFFGDDFLLSSGALLVFILRTSVILASVDKICTFSKKCRIKPWGINCVLALSYVPADLRLSQHVWDLEKEESTRQPFHVIFCFHIESFSRRYPWKEAFRILFPFQFFQILQWRVGLQLASEMIFWIFCTCRHVNCSSYSTPAMVSSYRKWFRQKPCCFGCLELEPNRSGMQCSSFMTGKYLCCIHQSMLHVSGAQRRNTWLFHLLRTWRFSMLTKIGMFLSLKDLFCCCSKYWLVDGSYMEVSTGARRLWWWGLGGAVPLSLDCTVEHTFVSRGHLKSVHHWRVCWRMMKSRSIRFWLEPE